MAQIIKHRRGSITQLKDVTARIGELVVATGSISDLNGPMVFVGETEGVAGAYRPLSKIYQGSTAPTISVGSHGSVIDGTPFYATGNKTLYILNKDGNTDIDLTGNIEGNTISGVTINNLTGSTAYIANVSGSFTGSGIGLYDIPASGITGLELNRISDGSATASISQTNGLRVNTNTEITGALIVTSNISGSNLYLSGNANIDGNITLGGNITIGDATTDIINFGGEVSSSIVPDVHNAFDLGSSTKNWRNLHVSGTAYVDTLEARQVNFTDLGVLEDLIVSGSTFLGNGGDITVVSGSLYNDALTNNRVVIVGTNGLIEDDANFTFDGTVLNIGQGNLEADVADGDIRTSGSLLVKNSAIVTGSLGVHGHIDLSNEAQIRITDDTANTVYGFYDGSNILGAYYQMFGSDYANAAQRGGAEFVFDSTNSGQGGFNIAEYNGSTWLRKLFVDASGLAVTGTTTLNGNLIVTGTTEAKGAVGINSTLDVTGSAQFKGTINVDGESTLASGQTVNGDVTVNGVLTVTGNTQLQSNLYISGNLEVLGSATNVTIQSTTIELDDNIIRLNAYSPFERYAGFEVIDSGSTGVSASLVWDGQNDYWMFVSSSGESSKLLGTTAGTYGTETSLTNTYFPIATGPNTIGDSLLRYSGTTLSFNTNKFTIDSGTGDTLVSGNFTLSYSGGTDNGNNTSAIMFRNSSNVVGFVTTTETTDVLDGILGYKNSDGALVFSTVIDGGGY